SRPANHPPSLHDALPISGTLHHLALIVRLGIGDLDLGGQRLDLLLAEAERGEVAVIKLLHRMAVGADLLVDLEAALQRRAIEGRSEEHTSELQSRENLVC